MRANSPETDRILVDGEVSHYSIDFEPTNLNNKSALK